MLFWEFKLLLRHPRFFLHLVLAWSIMIQLLYLGIALWYLSRRFFIFLDPLSKVLVFNFSLSSLLVIFLFSVGQKCLPQIVWASVVFSTNWSLFGSIFIVNMSCQRCQIFLLIRLKIQIFDVSLEAFVRYTFIFRAIRALAKTNDVLALLFDHW